MSDLPAAERNSPVRVSEGDVSSLNAKLSKRFLITFSKSISLKIQKKITAKIVGYLVFPPLNNIHNIRLYDNSVELEIPGDLQYKRE